MFLFYGTLRAATLVPTIFTILGKKVREQTVFYGVICAVTIGLPLFVYGSLTKNPAVALCGSIYTVLCPLLFIIVDRRVNV
jgi:hypothetical protein